VFGGFCIREQEREPFTVRGYASVTSSTAPDPPSDRQLKSVCGIAYLLIARNIDSYLCQAHNTPTTQRGSATLKALLSVASSIRTARLSNISCGLRIHCFEIQHRYFHQFPARAGRSRVLSMSTPAELSDSSGTSLFVSSPSINLNLTARQPSKVDP